MLADDFAFLARLLRRRSGLSLMPDKMALAARRLDPVMRRFGFRDMDSLIRELRLGREALAESVTQAMTVNDTSFFRDHAVFNQFATSILPRLLAARAQQKRLRIWSAAVASGQEAYSIAMILCDMGLARQGWTLDLIATDLSSKAIVRAQTGRYGSSEVGQGLNDSQIARYFCQDGAAFVAHESLRRMISFRPFNLLDSFGWLDDLDAIFCRNVLLFFDFDMRTNILERMSEIMTGDAVLLLGENEVADCANFMRGSEGPGIYVRSRASIARAS